MLPQARDHSEGAPRPVWARIVDYAPAGVPLPFLFRSLVARLERSESRDRHCGVEAVPAFAPLKPGYEMFLQWRGKTRAQSRRGNDVICSPLPAGRGEQRSAAHAGLDASNADAPHRQCERSEHDYGIIAYLPGLKGDSILATAPVAAFTNASPRPLV